jgi:streptogramin lyase/mono/diheme cytochrome c family protein
MRRFALFVTTLFLLTLCFVGSQIRPVKASVGKSTNKTAGVTSRFDTSLGFSASSKNAVRTGEASNVADKAADSPAPAPIIGPSSAGLKVEPGPDDLQRSYRTDHYLEVADSGVDRGENIYWHKCWACHNKYQQHAPQLEGLFKMEALITGLPVTEENVAAHIKKGGPGMPSFGTTLSDADVKDLVSYLHSDKCCVEGEHLPANPWYRAETNKWTVQTGLVGGATGTVRIASGDSPEGVMVQLIAPSGVRTTVYTNEEGKFEFPKMQAGSYILRIANPLELKPYRRDDVRIDGATKLDDIVLERISKTRALPPTPEVEAQMSGEELLWNLPGTLEEKEALHNTCALGCHSFQQIFKNRYDERSWGVLVARMLHRGGGPLINDPLEEPSPQALAVDKLLTKWLAKVRGPDAVDSPLYTYPRLTGESNRVVVTEFELPRALMSAHDVYGDGQGNIWYTSHLSRYFGKLDTRTGVVTEYQTPLTPGAQPGTHHVFVEKNGEVLISEPWAHKLLKVDSRNGEMSEVSVEAPFPINSAGMADFDLTPDGYVWATMGGGYSVEKIDPATGKMVRKYPMKIPFSYDGVISWDGNFWSGGAISGTTGNTAELLDIRTGEMLNLDSGTSRSAGRRGGFDPYGNAWFGGENGTLVELDARAKRIREFSPPGPMEPYRDFYSVESDKNGEIWGGELHGRAFLRYNPKTEHWTEYAMPEPYSHSRCVFVDRTSSPTVLWYADYSTGRIVRIQPYE